MGKEIFALSQQQKSFHSKALKSSPRQAADIWLCYVNVSRSGAPFSLTRKSSGGAGGWMRLILGLGIDAVIPSDWCGFGCTVMSRRELSLAQFDGYAGTGHGRSLHRLETMASEHKVRRKFENSTRPRWRPVKRKIGFKREVKLG